ncbi:PepSY-associated TM helix domain-containing protein [Candidatus Rariloculus sp.]|uniref:PepSY-associated TM helix domain-containing protein n=1 Tax=Candidatus Rariloculus sp. TaxID=3101265 RepID=UPI003D0E74C8
MFRKTIFWIHLICGVLTGVIVIMMSATGVVLTYERQMLAWVDRAQFAEPRPGAAPLPVAELLDAARGQDPDFEATSVSLSIDPRAPATVSAGRSSALRIDRYSGEVFEPGGERLRSFFGAMTGWHRWFNASRENRAIPRAITGASNLAFLFLILSGFYLWLPPSFKWVAFKTRLLFNGKAVTAKARDLNWHHVFGIWSAIPLAIVVATAVVFSYGWANDLVYLSVGENPPGSGGPTGGRAVEPTAAHAGPHGAYETRLAPLPFDALFERASMQLDGWQTITLELPRADSATARLTIDQGNGGQPQKRHRVTLDRYTGHVEQWQPFDSQSTGRQARSWIRFLHTGEALGITGQTIAGLVSVTSLIMVWTGLTLAYRRLVAPLLKQRRPRPAFSAGMADGTRPTAPG